MEKNYRFTYQDNQFTGECLPCTLAQFKSVVSSGSVAWRINTRQMIERAINDGLSLNTWTNDATFRNFCLKQEQRPRAGADFAALPVEKKLVQWANSLKMWLPCFIFAVEEFEAVEKTDKDGNPVLDKEGRPVKFRQRKQYGIKRLSGLFMFDGDHLPVDPQEIYQRTLRPGFPWQVRLAHKTSSGYGLRLVCEARPDIGNIADNQIEVARELGLLGMTGTTGKPVTDNSCIDASRISYAPRECDIYFIDEDKLFNYQL